MPILELRTLGGVAVLVGGQPAVGAAAQPKPLALLAMLAAAGEHGLTRDKLIAYLWPDTDIERGRSVLRQTLYSLRRDLSAPDLFLPATPALHLNPAIIVADRSAFIEAYGEGLSRKAIDLYNGPFLDGFHLSDAPEFERWVDAQRDDLAERYRSALEDLATRAGACGDQVGAAGWWRQLHAQDPLNTRIALAYMRALEQAGEPVQALEVAESYERILRDELGAGLDAGVAEEMGRIRAGLSHSSPPRPAGVTREESRSSAQVSDKLPAAIPADASRRAPRSAALAAALGLIAAGAGFGLFGGPERPVPGEPEDRPVELIQTLAVLPFEDRSISAERRFYGEPLTEELSRQIAMVSSIRVVGPGTTAPYRHRDDGIARLTKDLAVDAVLSGEVGVDDGLLGLSVRLVKTDDGRTLWSRQYSEDLAGIFTVQRAVARGVAAALGVSPSAAEGQRMEQVPTRSIAAYELYLRSTAMSHVNRVENAAGMALLKQAIGHDSSFAFALAMLSRRFMFHGFLVDPIYADSGLAAVQRALALKPDLGVAHFALGDLQVLVGHPSAARLSYLKALELDPSYLPAMVDLSDADVTLGRFDEALYWALRSVRLNPTSAGFHAHAGVALYFLGLDEATERWLADGQRRWPGYQRFAVGLARLDYARGRDSSALSRLRAFAATDPENEEVTIALAGFAALVGAPEAEALVNHRLRASPHALPYTPARESFQALQALVLRRRGAAGQARAAEDSAFAAATALMRAGKEEVTFALELAALCALRDSSAAALDWLERAYAAGERDYRMTLRDPFFAGIKDEARFRRILARMESDVVVMRKRAVAANADIFVTMKTHQVSP